MVPSAREGVANDPWNGTVETNDGVLNENSKGEDTREQDPDPILQAGSYDVEMISVPRVHVWNFLSSIFALVLV